MQLLGLDLIPLIIHVCHEAPSLVALRAFAATICLNAVPDECRKLRVDDTLRML